MIRGCAWSPADLAIRCMDVHHNTLAALLVRGIPALITVGEVYVDGVPKFDTSPESLTADAADGDVTRPVKAHAWLTLPGLQVVDITIRSYLEGSRRCPTDLHSWAVVGCPVMEPPLGELNTCSLGGDPVHLRWNPLVVGTTWIDLANPTIDGLPRLRVLDSMVMHRFLRA